MVKTLVSAVKDPKWFLLLIITWFLGFVVNTNYLMSYGLFDWALFDLDNFTSGLLFMIIFILPGVIFFIILRLFDRATYLINKRLVILYTVISMLILAALYLEKTFHLLGLLIFASLLTNLTICIINQQYIYSVLTKRSRLTKEIDKKVKVILYMLFTICLASVAVEFGKNNFKNFPKVFYGGKFDQLYWTYNQSGDTTLAPGPFKLLLESADYSYVYCEHLHKAYRLNRGALVTEKLIIPQSHDLTGLISPKKPPDFEFTVFGDTRTDVSLPWGKNDDKEIREILKDRYPDYQIQQPIDTLKKMITLIGKAKSDIIKLWSGAAPDYMPDSLYVILNKDSLSNLPGGDTIIVYHEYGVKAIYYELSKMIGNDNTDFLINTGDLVLWSKTSDNKYWRFFENEFYEKVKGNNKAHHFFPVIGNHEYWKDGDASNYFLHFPHLKDQNNNLHYYSFLYGNSGFIFLCSGWKCGDGHFSSCWNCDQANFDVQLEWMKKRIKTYADAGIKHLFITFHKPPFSSSNHPGLVDKVNPIYSLAQLKKQYPGITFTVFNGHNHTTEYYEYYGIKVFVAGGGGAPQYLKKENHPGQFVQDKFWDEVRKSERCESYNYLSVQVHGDDIDYVFHEYNSNTKHFDNKYPVPE